MDNSGRKGEEFEADDLTWREQEILLLLAEHLTNREIANRLHLAETTVKDYVGRILSKLYVKNRRQAVKKANELGLMGVRETVETKPKVQLPTDPTPFVGRVGELVEIKHLLSGTRLLTLTGPGGIGKTRLALRTARDVSGSFRDGVFFISLAPIRTVDSLVQAIAETLKFPLATHEDPHHQLLRYLQVRETLLVMDNFEHLLEGAGIVSEILGTCAGVKVLATSRERLNLQPETVYQVGGMAAPEVSTADDILEYDALTLFVQSASKVRLGFDPNPEEMRQITNICQMVEGMPLAIELAAAWLHLLNTDEIAWELRRGLDILSSERRDTPRRHRSLRAVFDHSWSLLEPDEQVVFMQLSVFRGGFTREAAQQVTGASIQLLGGLVDKSILSHDPGTGRLEIHELLRQYAQEQLELDPEADLMTHEAHAAYYAEFMQERWEGLRGPQQIRVLMEVEADMQNVRAAWRFYLEQQVPPQLWKFIYGLWYMYWVRWWNHAGMELFREAVQVLKGTEDPEMEILHGLCMAFQGYFMGWLDLGEEGYRLAKAGVEVLEGHNEPLALVLALDSLSVNAYFTNRYAEEVETINKMITLAEALADPWLSAFTLFAKSMVSMVMGDSLEATRLAETNLSISDGIGDRISATMPLFVLGHAALARGEMEEARAYYLRSLEMSQDIGYHFAIQTATKYLGKVTLSLGYLDEAEWYLRQSLQITREIGFLRDILNLLVEFARLEIIHEEPEAAVELLAYVIQNPVSTQNRLIEGAILDSAQELLETLEAELPPEVYNLALERGLELDLEERISNLIGTNRYK